MGLSLVQEALEDIREGRIVVVVDDEERDDQGDLVMAAEKVTPDDINFMASQGRGLICLPMTPERLDFLRIPLMPSKNLRPDSRAFCVSIESSRDVTTGISAADRAMTVLRAIDPSSQPSDIIMPGHIFPMRACRGGVLQRAGQTEAAVDLARIAGLSPAGVTCQVMNEEGELARLPELQRFAQRHGLKIITIVDLIKFRLATERFVRLLETASLECDFGSFEVRLYENSLDGRRHLALVKGEVAGDGPTLVRVHAESVLSDVFLSHRSQSGRELRIALKLIEEAGRGVLVYLRMNDREKRLLSEIEEHQGKPPRGPSQVTFREFGVGAQILSDLGLRQIRLLTNHPKKIVALRGFNLDILEEIPIPVEGCCDSQHSAEE